MTLAQLEERPGRLPETESDSDRVHQWLQERSGKEGQTLPHHLRHDQRLDYTGGSGGQSDSESVLNWGRGLWGNWRNVGCGVMNGSEM